MIKVYVKKQSNYPADTPRIKRELQAFFKARGIVSAAEVSVALIGEKKMLELGKKFLKDNKLHNVLSFNEEETKTKFSYPPGGPIHLGEIIVCYPQAVKEAQQENKLTDEKISELVCHGALHLLGIHHK